MLIPPVSSIWRSCDASVDPRSRHVQNHASRWRDAKSHEHGGEKFRVDFVGALRMSISQNAERGGVAATALASAQMS